MKKIIALSSLAVLYCLLCAQSMGPDGNIYGRYCQQGDQYLIDAEAWFDDPDNDCVSTNYYIRYYGVDETGSIFYDVTGGAPFDFGQSYYLGGEAGWWNCCPPQGSGGGGGGDNQYQEDCTFYIDANGVVTIDCKP